jgi:hypothetical protein
MSAREIQESPTSPSSENQKACYRKTRSVDPKNPGVQIIMPNGTIPDAGDSRDPARSRRFSATIGKPGAPLW